MTVFAGRREGDVLRLTMSDGTVREGSFIARGGMGFLHVDGAGWRGRVIGPFPDDDVASVAVVRDALDVERDSCARRRGAPVPGLLRRDRDGYEARLDRLARAAARETGKRRREVVFQFDEVADEIDLARAKRKWMLAAAAWTLHSNEEPDKYDLSGNDPTKAEALSRPRPQDFDPDPKVRRASVRPSERVRADPRSTRNMAKALRDAGFRAKVSVFEETTDDAVRLLVEPAGGKSQGRFMVEAARDDGGSMSWRFSWAGQGTGVDGVRMRRCEASGTFAAIADVLRTGLTTATRGRTRDPGSAVDATPEGGADSARVRP